MERIERIQEYIADFDPNRFHQNTNEIFNESLVENQALQATPGEIIDVVTGFFDIIQSGATIFEKLSNLCGCALTNRVGTDLTQLATLKDSFIETVGNLSDEIDNIGKNITDAANLRKLSILKNSISQTIEVIENTSFPECMDSVLQLSQLISNATNKFSKEIGAQLNNTLQNMQNIVNNIAQFMRDINIASENCC